MLEKTFYVDPISYMKENFKKTEIMASWMIPWNKGRRQLYSVCVCGYCGCY